MAESQTDTSPAMIATNNDHNYGATLDNESWKNFKITKSRGINDKEHDFKRLLENPPKSILGDTWICTKGGVKYYLDRAILTSRSNHLARLSKDNDKVDVGKIIVTTIQEDYVLIPIFQIMYGEDLKSVICERNFVDLLKNMCYLEMETDLEVFKQFIEETIKPKEQICHEMIKLYFFMLSSRVFEKCQCDYLLPTVSQYFSDRLLEAYEITEFLSLPFDGLFRILLHRKELESDDKGLIGRICAEWICYDFGDRVVKLVKLVNAAKHRYGIFHYFSADEVEEQSIINSLKEVDENLREEEVEECFNELLYYYGGIKFDPSQLADELSDESQNPTINAVDLTSRWVTFLEKGLFYDVIINVQGFTYKLHRIKLVSSSSLFYELFTCTENSKSSGSKVNDNTEERMMETHTFDEIDAAAFEKLIRYIYEGEIEITTEDLIINLLKASKFLQMDDLYEKCYVWCFDFIRKLTHVIFDLFQFVCEKEKQTDFYEEVVDRIISMWPKFDDNAFKNISLKVLKEIVALPELKMNTPDEVVDLCSKWIFHDMENRYDHMYKIAKAVNRSFAPNIKRLKLEIPDPENPVEYSLERVKKNLTQILSSSALVPLNSDPGFKSEHKPHFIAIRTEGTLSITDEYFNEIVSISLRTLPVYSTQASISINPQSASVVDDKLFILFNVDDIFHFYVYLLASKKFISLATDVRMDSDFDYVILNFNSEVYFFEDSISLKYCFRLNRWIRFMVGTSSEKWYASNGKILYKISFQEPTKQVSSSSAALKTQFYDYKQKTWTKLSNVPVRPSLEAGDPVKWNNLPISVNVIGNEFCVLFKSKTFFFHWKTQTWSSIDNLYDDFSTFTERDQNILYISAKNGVLLYSPVQKKWIADQKLNHFKSIFPIHTIMK